MNPAELEVAAQALYERNTLSAPSWDQLGAVTKGVWREAVQRRTCMLFTPVHVAEIGGMRPRVRLPKERVRL